MNILQHTNKAMATLYMVAAIALFFSCKKTDNTTTYKTETSPPIPSVVSFSVHIVPILNSSCNSSGCHSSVTPAANLNLTATAAYANLYSKHEIDTLNPTLSNLNIEINNGDMPKAPYSQLSNYDKQLILTWIQQKAKNN